MGASIMKNISFFLALSFCVPFILQTASFAQWIPLNGPGNTVYDMAVSDTSLFAGCQERVYLSTDNGMSWSTVFSLEIGAVYSLVISGTDLFIGTSHDELVPDGGVFLLPINGFTWTNVSSSLPKKTIGALAVKDTYLFAGSWGGGAFRSTNNGTSWTPINNGLMDTTVNTFTVSGKNLFAGCIYGIYLSENNGTSWTAVDSGLTSPVIYSILVSGTNLLAGTLNGLFLSTNNGTYWTKIDSGIPSENVYDFAAYGTILFAATERGVFRSTNNGYSWANVSDGLPAPVNNSSRIVYSLAVCGTDLFAGTAINQVYKRPLSELITSIEQVSYQIPENYNLSQNYPNPFNPSTSFEFRIAEPGFVSLKVFDVTGREVATIVSEGMKAGKYIRRWNAGDLASGVYLYRLQAGSVTQTKKLILLK